MIFDLVSYTDEHESLWDSWCESAGNSTLLHTRKFLGYHGARFADASVFIFESGRLVGVMPAARDLHDSTLVVSHPGATYGGIVHQGWLNGERMIDALGQLKAYYRERGYYSTLFDERRYGAKFSLTRALGSDFLIGSVSFTPENVGIPNVNPNSPTTTPGSTGRPDPSIRPY